MDPTAKNGAPSSWLARVVRRRAAKAILIIAGLAAAIAAGVFVYANRPIGVQVASAEENVPVRVFGLGTVEARILAKIGFEVGARLVAVNADHGDRVAKGDVLARLDAGEQEAKLAKARAGLLMGEVGVLRAGANLEKAEAVLAQKVGVNRRRTALAGRDVISQQAAEEAVRDEAVARAEVAVARAEIETAKAQLADARAQLQYEETMLRHRTLVAPFDALIVERHKETGTVIKAGDPIFTLIAAETIWGLAYVDEARAGFIREGQRVDARLRSRPQEAFTGRVVRIGLESDRVTEERRVFVKGDNPPPRVYLGEQAEFWITVATLDRALLVPEAAVQAFDGREGRVWTVEAGRLQRRPVKIRHRTEDARLEIVGGLPDGARVVTRVEDGFREGRRARVAETGTR
jgi:HlyD family secretion protein